jgi:hypothetical protein
MKIYSRGWQIWTRRWNARLTSCGDDIKPNVSLFLMPWTRNVNVNRISEREGTGVRLVMGAILDATSVQPFHHHAATKKCSKWGLSRL